MIGARSDEGAATERYSFAREWFATQPPKVEKLALQRYRWARLRYDWPTMTAVKATYRRRNR